MSITQSDNFVALRRWLRMIAAALLLPVAYLLSRPLAPEQVEPWNPLVLGYTVVMLAACALLLAISLPLLAISFARTREKLVRRLRKFALLGTSTLVCIVALDVIVKKIPTLEVWNRPSLRLQGALPSVDDKELAFRWQPGQSSSPEWGGIHGGDIIRRGEVAEPLATHEPENGMKWTLTLDADGFINPTVPDRCDIFVVGDSICVPSVPPQYFWPAILGKKMNQSCYNAGVCGYTSPQELIVLKRHGLPKKPKIVLWAFYQGNDLVEAAWYEQFKKSGLDWPTFAMKTFSAPRKSFLYERPLVRLLMYLASGGRSSELDSRREPEIKYPGPLTLKAGGVEKPIAFAKELFYSVAIPRETMRSSAAWRICADSIKDAKAECGKIGARFVVIYFPEKLTVFGDYAVPLFDKDEIYRFARPFLEDIGNVGPDEFMKMLKENRAAQYDVLKELCLHEKIELLDLTPALKAAVERGEWPYYCYDVHINIKGNEVVAQAVRDYLTRLP